MAFIKSDMLSMNIVDVVFLLSQCSIKHRLLFREFFKEIKKSFIIFLQILKMQKFKCFKEKINWYKTQNALMCLKEKFKKKHLQSVSMPLCLRQNIFFLYSPENFLCLWVLIYFSCTWNWVSPVFLKKETQNVINK